MNTQELTHSWLTSQSDRYDMMKHIRLMNELEKYDHKTYDRRKETKCGDTYIIAITK